MKTRSIQSILSNALYITALVTQFTPCIGQATGSLDPTFNGTGKLITNTPENFASSSGNAICVQNNGTVVVAGMAGDGRFVAGVQDNGSFATGWGNGSAVGLNNDNYCSQSCGSGLTALKALPNGGFVAAGWTYFTGSTEGKRFFLERYGTSGIGQFTTPVFNGVGHNITSGDDVAYDIAVQDDGKMVLVGAAGSSAIGVIRVQQNGMLDQSFGDDQGRQQVNITNGDAEYANACHVYADGKILLVGQVLYGNITKGVIFRLQPDGQLDNSFSNDGVTNGWQEIDFVSGSESGLRDVHVAANGDIYVSGFLRNPFDRDLGIAKLTNAGNYDQAFGNNGIVVHDLGEPLEIGVSLLLQPDGKLLLVGHTGDLDANETFVTRYLSNGTLDATFGQNGVARIQVQTLSYAKDAVLDQSGRLLVTGSTSLNGGTDKTFVLRVITGAEVGVLELSMNEGMVNVYPNPVNENTSINYTLLEAEHLTIALHDLQGRVLATYLNNKSMSMGDHKQDIDLPPDLASGNYLLIFSSPNGRMSFQVNKQ